MAFLPIIVKMLGLITTATTNAMYPTYPYASNFTYEVSEAGIAFCGYDQGTYRFFQSKINTTITADIYYSAYNVSPNANQNFLIKNVNYEMNITWYEIDDDDEYIEQEQTDTFSIALEDYEITANNINNTYFTMDLIASDVFEYAFTNPLYRNGTGIIYRGYLEAPQYEAIKYVEYEYRYLFDINQINEILINSADANFNYNKGYQEGYSAGNSNGYNEGYGQGKTDGYNEGYQSALDDGSTAATIFSGIITVGLLPVNVFLGILNFEVFGINIGAFVGALLTVAIVIIIIKMFTGSSGGGKSD